MAFPAMGDGDGATDLFGLLNPIHYARTRADVLRYKVEPYAVAADVQANPSHIGRDGWTWCTGSAGWMQRAGGETDNCFVQQCGRSDIGFVEPPPLRCRLTHIGDGARKAAFAMRAVATVVSAHRALQATVSYIEIGRVRSGATVSVTGAGYECYCADRRLERIGR